MRKFKILSALLVTILSAYILCGCFDEREIDETAYIIALGIDKGEGNDYIYTFQFSAPLAVAGGGGGESESSGQESSSEKAEIKDSGNPTVNNIVITAPDFYVAKNMTNNFLSKNINMSHLKLIVFSHNLDSDGLSGHSQFLLREREIRPHTAVAAAKQSAQEYILSVNPELEANTAKYYELMSLRSNNVYAPTKKLSDFVDEISKAGGSSALPLASIADKEDNRGKNASPDGFWIGSESAKLSSSRSDFRGMALFKSGILCGTMNGDSAMLYNILNRDIQSCIITLRSPYRDSDHFSFRLLVDAPASYHVNCAGNPCLINVKQNLGLEFLGSRIPEGFSSIDELYAFADSVLETRITEFFFDISRVKKSDIMKIGDSFKQRFLTQHDWENMNWSQLYETADFDVDIE
ncbi:MAG: hypothetical protein IKW64_00835 [Clostridia bacterium]|nr:hypothetical protein [Clostridia bacterium]